MDIMTDVLTMDKDMMTFTLTMHMDIITVTLTMHIDIKLNILAMYMDTMMDIITMFLDILIVVYCGSWYKNGNYPNLAVGCDESCRNHASDYHDSYPNPSITIMMRVNHYLQVTENL